MTPGSYDTLFAWFRTKLVGEEAVFLDRIPA